jgi:SMC interacting uncharacterized protein involved in chromosome segregation
MTAYEKERIDMELRQFALRNFERPSDCRNLEQIRFYVRELCEKIEDMDRRFNFVPNSAYSLLAQYNARQNNLLLMDFKSAYC